MQTIYIEEAVADYPRTKRICERLGQHAHIIPCHHYGEVFNPKSQNFRLQKKKPALILARKQGRLVLPTPPGFGVGGEHNYYFSHMLNCLYDCRYCFLQGMYHSANYVLFVNYEDFLSSIDEVLEQHQGEDVYFFSGYDGDSLAFDAVSGFIASVLPFFAERPRALLELRSKSTHIQPLLKAPVIKNCIIAFSFTPDSVSQQLEKGVPPVAKRIQAMRKLAMQGWQIGLRFDPLIYAQQFDEIYAKLLADIFSQVPATAIHSVSTGPLRFPYKMYQTLAKLYPYDKLMAQPLERRGRNMSYAQAIEQHMTDYLHHELAQYVSEPIIFKCNAL